MERGRESGTNRNAAIAVFVMHAESNYISFSACTELAQRGFTVFCAQNGVSKVGGETDVDLDTLMTAVGTGVTYLQTNLTDEIDKVVLFGHSGGGAMMSAYQNIAENGLAACNGTEKLGPCDDTLADLPPADGVLLADANYGLSSMHLLSLGAEIIDETDGHETNYSLSIYNPANGFNATGVSNYTPEFTKEFQSAVAKRMQRNVAWALAQKAALAAGNATFDDDEQMYVLDGSYGIENNKFFAQDTSFLAHTVHAWPLLHKNASTTTEVVHTVRVPVNFDAIDAASLSNALKSTVTKYLNSYALRVTDDFGYNATGFQGVDWASSHMVPEQAVPGITVPLLTMGMTGHWEYLNAEKIYLASGSNDTSICFVEGAYHTFETCTDCEAYPGEFGDTTKLTYDYMASWLGEEGRFL